MHDPWLFLTNRCPGIRYSSMSVFFPTPSLLQRNCAAQMCWKWSQSKLVKCSVFLIWGGQPRVDLYGITGTPLSPWGTTLHSVLDMPVVRLVRKSRTTRVTTRPSSIISYTAGTSQVEKCSALTTDLLDWMKGVSEFQSEHFEHFGNSFMIQEGCGATVPLFM